MDERVRFARLLDGEKMAALCEEFGISGVPYPAVAAEQLVAHGQIRGHDRTNLRRARGVE